MKDREIQHYHLQGYGEFYSKALLPIKKALAARLPDEDGSYCRALVEAVENAAAYAHAGPEQACIDIDLVATDLDVSTTVSSDTVAFDFDAFRDKLRRLAADKHLGELDWCDWTAGTCRSRGCWQMLAAVDFLYVEARGRRVTLLTTCPAKGEKNHPRSKKIRDIVPRLMLMRHGRIY